MAEPTGDKKKEVKQKRPSALKRDMQNEKRRIRNRSYRAKVSTAIRSFEKALSQKEESNAVQSKLSAIFSLMDKGVKTGVYKRHTAARTKSRLHARAV
jgi:small subunit ribosomal protein S20